MSGEKKGLLAHLDITGERVVVVGGGRVARRKIARLVACGAHVVCVSPEMECDPGAGVEVVARAFEARDLEGARLVFAATSDEGLNERIVELARARGVFVSSASSASGSLMLLARVRHAHEAWLSVGVSTHGGAPAVASALASKLGEWLEGQAWGERAQVMGVLRGRLELGGAQRARAAFWRGLARTGAGSVREWSEAIRQGAREQGLEELEGEALNEALNGALNEALDR